MPTGVCKFWRQENGYGFLRPDDGSADVFANVSTLSGDFSGLVTNQRVEWESGISQRTGREAATKVTLLEPILSPKREARAFRADDDDRDADEQLASTAFLQR